MLSADHVYIMFFFIKLKSTTAPAKLRGYSAVIHC